MMNEFQIYYPNPSCSLIIKLLRQIIFYDRSNEILWRWAKACADMVLVGIFSPFGALKTEARKKMVIFNISVFLVTSFDFRPFQTDNKILETHIFKHSC